MSYLKRKSEKRNEFSYASLLEESLLDKYELKVHQMRPEGKANLGPLRDLCPSHEKYGQCFNLEGRSSHRFTEDITRT